MTTDSTVAADAQLAREVYGDRVVDKRLATQQAFKRLPRYVTEFLVAKFVREGHEQEDIEAIKERLKGRIPESDQKEIIKNRLMRDGGYSVIDQLEVEVDLNSNRHRARLSCLDHDHIAIDTALVDQHESLLSGGLWGTCTLTYNPGAGVRDKITVTGFDPFQISRVDLPGFIDGRRHFSLEEWTRLLLRSAGYEPDRVVDRRRQWLLLARLVPLVQQNVNLVELGPKGTGKTFLLRNLSPTVFTISGGRASPASLFLHKTTRRIGLIGTRKVVVFDEVAATTFPEKETVSALKDYMESGQYSRGRKTVASDASIVLTGNLDVTGNQPSDRYVHLFQELPPALIDSAFLDRIHGYLPGWEMPKILDLGLAQGIGFLTDYFGEVLRRLREEDFSRRFEAFEFDGSNSTVRDTRGARRIAEGMAKLLYPDGNFSDEQAAELLRFGAELRQRVHNQLSQIAPGEFPPRAIEFAGMEPLDAPDLRAKKSLDHRDAQANAHPATGEVTGLAVMSIGDATSGGDVFFIEASLVTGPVAVETTGVHDKVLRESVVAAWRALQGLGGRWKAVAQRAAEARMSVHLVNIAELREGPSGGAAFVTAMASALLGRPVRPALAMTGEVSLHGHIEPIEGIEHKIAAAANHGRKLVLIPAQNARDLDDVPDDVLDKIDVRTVESIEEVLDLAFEEEQTAAVGPAKAPAGPQPDVTEPKSAPVGGQPAGIAPPAKESVPGAKTSRSHPLRIDWVRAGAGQVGMTFCPGKKQAHAVSGPWDRDVNADLDVVADAGAAALVSLLEPDELDALQVPELGDAAESRGLDWHLISIRDGGIPDARAEARWAYVSRKLSAALTGGRPVVLHCKGGLGRTGTMAARLLMETGDFAASDAIAACRSARPGTIETSEQESYLRRLAPGRPRALDRLDRALGCLLGGAVGDGFGYAVEFKKLRAIRDMYGPRGLEEPELHGGALIVSDDTQMTLFTAEGLIRAAARGNERGIVSWVSGGHQAYLRWLDTQGEAAAVERYGPSGWLMNEPAMRHRRAPGGTCLSGLRADRPGTMDEPLNESKGCGGVMRVAPVGLFPLLDRDDAFQVGCELAAITHGHPSGYLAAGALAAMIRDICSGSDLRAAANEALRLLADRLSSDEVADKLRQAVALAADRVDADAAIAKLGQGWVAEEALAVGLYAALVGDTFEEVVRIAANHDGDSDSTASIAGQLYGALHGTRPLPNAWLRRLDVLDPILLLAHDLIAAGDDHPTLIEYPNVY